MSTPAPLTPAADRSPIVVKFVAKGHQYRHRAVFLRQFPENSGEWGRCRFVFDPELRDYDWLAVYDDLPPHEGERFSSRIEELACAPEHTLFVTMEPSSIKVYGREFLRQFGTVLTSQEPWAVAGAAATHSQPALRWFYGASENGFRTWDDMVTRPPLAKSGDLSTVCSSKQQRHSQHAARYEFTMRLRELLPEMVVFGRGVRPIADKAEALDTFRYHIVIENHLAPHHWTEKLADAFLGLTLPFYCGCPNAADYFPAESFIPIDVANPDVAARVIRSAMESREFERRLPALLEARRRVLYEYNLFAVLSRLIDERFDAARKRTAGAVVRSRHAARVRTPWQALTFSLEQWRVRGHSRRLQQELRKGSQRRAG